MYWYRGQRDKSGRVLSEASCNREASRGMEETCRADSLGLHATRFLTRRSFPLCQKQAIFSDLGASPPST